MKFRLNPLNAKLNPISHLLALLGAHLILQISRIRVKEKIRGNDCALLQGDMQKYRQRLH
jgi:hypothetical protein